MPAELTEISQHYRNQNYKRENLLFLPRIAYLEPIAGYSVPDPFSKLERMPIFPLSFRTDLIAKCLEP